MSDSTYAPVAGVTWGVVSGGSLAPGADFLESEHEVIRNGDDCTGGGAPPAGTHTCASTQALDITYVWIMTVTDGDFVFSPDPSASFFTTVAGKITGVSVELTGDPPQHGRVVGMTVSDGTGSFDVEFSPSDTTGTVVNAGPDDLALFVPLSAGAEIDLGTDGSNVSSGVFIITMTITYTPS